MENITPAILTSSIEDLFSQINRYKKFFPYMQIDIADGKFVKNTTISLEEIKEKLIKEKHIFKNISFDIHLMVEDTNNSLLECIEISKYIKIRYILIHHGVHPFIEQIQSELPSNIKLGLVLNPEDDIKEIINEYDINIIPAIQIMSVNPGFQGSSFIEETLEKIALLKQLKYNGKILIDGAVNEKTLKIILSKKHKPDIFGIGSYISKAENIEKRYLEISNIFNN